VQALLKDPYVFVILEEQSIHNTLHEILKDKWALCVEICYALH